jgi:uncharacterized phage-associated protein
MSEVRAARDVAAAIRERIPGVGIKRLHILMYFAQGHHLATFDEPLFHEEIFAYAWGPCVRDLWREENRARRLARTS